MALAPKFIRENASNDEAVFGWKRILLSLLGWDDAQVVYWANELPDDKTDENHELFHDGPMDYRVYSA